MTSHHKNLLTMALNLLAQLADESEYIQFTGSVTRDSTYDISIKLTRHDNSKS